MPKVNQKEVKDKLEKWAELQAKLKKIEAGRNNELAPLVEKHNAETAPVLAKYEAKTSPLRQQATALETEITKLLNADVDGDGNPKPVTIDGGAALAVVERKEGSRVINVQKFFDYVKDRNTAFWNSLSVTIKEAEKIVGKSQIDDLSTKKTTFNTSIKLK